MPLETEKRIAMQAVMDASTICREVQANLVSENTLIKKDRSPVTVADFASQAIVLHTITQSLPGQRFVGEESADALRKPESALLKENVVAFARCIHGEMSEADVLSAIDQGRYEGGGSGRFWTLDPIDGTKGFLRKEQYAIALALIEDGKVILGLLACPNLPYPTLSDTETQGALFVAQAGCGATMCSLDGKNETPIQVAALDSVSDSVFCESVESGHSSHSDSQRIADQLGITTEPARIDSQCKYAVVSRGDASIYLRLPTSDTYQEKIWDHAAGCLVVTEAGGRVTDIYGCDLDFSLGRTLQNNKGVVASSGTFHTEVLQAVQDVLGIVG
jgi:3'(2'), 5'-bisphosphate nucleotidase